MFLEITGRDGFDINIRTKGTFNRHVTAIDRNGTVSFRKYKGRRTPDFTGCHKAVADYCHKAVADYLDFLAGK